MPYTVRSGDTFWSIAQKLGISVDGLEAANPGVNPTGLQVGQTLSLGGGPTYTIQAGDTLWAICQAHNWDVASVRAANPGLDVNNLQVGQVIKVPANADSPSGPPPSRGSGYVQYGGPASNFPEPSQWASWDTLWRQNVRLMKFHDSDDEIKLIHAAINTVAPESGIDPRVILCIIVQESGGNVRIPTTNNGVRNPGLMQSHNGVSFNPGDPAGSIIQMVRDGTEGTAFGPGLKQLYAQYGNYYSAFRAYNSGSVNAGDLNDPVGATGSYVRDAANRLMGHTWDNM